MGTDNQKNIPLFRSVEIKGQFFPPPLKELEKSFAGLPHLPEKKKQQNKTNMECKEIEIFSSN